MGTNQLKEWVQPGCDNSLTRSCLAQADPEEVLGLKTVTEGLVNRYGCLKMSTRLSALV